MGECSSLSEETFCGEEKSSLKSVNLSPPGIRCQGVRSADLLPRMSAKDKGEGSRVVKNLKPLMPGLTLVEGEGRRRRVE